MCVFEMQDCELREVGNVHLYTCCELLIQAVLFLYEILFPHPGLLSVCHIKYFVLNGLVLVLCCKIIFNLWIYEIFL